MDVLNFGDALVAFLNIGLFSSLVNRFTGANTAILVFCSLLYLGSTPLETVGIMLTYLVFMRLTIYTQKKKLNFKRMHVFKGYRVILPIVLIIVSLFIYPFAALAIFLLLFMTEILYQMWQDVPMEHRASRGQLTGWIITGAVLTTIGMVVVKFIPGSIYYIIGGIAAFLVCLFFWWIGQDRERLEGIWDKVVLFSFLFLGLFGFDTADWLDDMRRQVNKTPIAYNLPFIFLPVFFIGFLMANVLFGIFSLSGLVITFFGAISMRLFGYYEVSRKGKANLVSLGFTVLAILLLLITAPEPTGISQAVDAFLPANTYGFHGILNMF